MKPRPIGPVSLGVPAARAAGSLRLSRRLRRGRMARVKASVTGSTGGRAEGSVRSVTGTSDGRAEGSVRSVTASTGGRAEGSVRSVTGTSDGRAEGSVRSVTGTSGGRAEGSVRSVTGATDGLGFGQLTKRLSIITREPRAPRAKGGKSLSSETQPQALHASREAAGKWRTERELKTRPQPLGPLARPSPRVALTLI